QGTTVSISNLFKFLPVRRQELLRSSKRELLKLIDCVQAFAISHPKCRFNCSNVVNGKPSQLLSSPGGNTQLIDVITNLLGTPKNELLELSESIPEEDIQQIYKINNTNCENIFKQIRLSGYISNFEYGRCKIVKEKHFIYVNGRHIESQRLSKIANDLYGQYNKCGQRCILILFISIPSSTLDVNVTPDKKTLFLHFEKEVWFLNDILTKKSLSVLRQRLYSKKKKVLFSGLDN
uniref:DNA mismatch repair protein S5 domain-containing protein n=1 Tax=Meloidogyne incognita TaxID=6306 RepID=A0A914NCV4_MELIC